MGRVELVKSSIHIMLIHSIMIYAWLVSLLIRINKVAYNFIWRGDVAISKVVSVQIVCKSLSKGGLGICSIVALNEVAK